MEIAWQAPEYEHFEKGPGWFLVVGAVTVILILVAIIFKNLLFAFLLLVGGFALMLYGARIPDLVNFRLTARGLRVNDRLYPYDHLDSFWMSEEKSKPKIIVHLGRWFLPHLILPLSDEITSDKARDFLLQYLPEIHQEETLTDLLFDYLGF